MRVIGGTARGRLLKGAPAATTRSTSDKVRGAIFDILAPSVDERTRVLDLFAGTGALGIEALSRGAAHACFVDQNSACCAVIRTNLGLCDLTPQGRVLCLPVSTALTTLERELSSTGGDAYDLIVMDPPYDDPRIDAVLRRLSESSLVRGDALVVFEHSKRQTWGEDFGRLSYRRTKVYGDTAVTFWHCREDSGKT